MNTRADCERVRLQLMALLDGEVPPAAEDRRLDVQQHLAGCSSCAGWAKALESMNSQFQAVSYSDSGVDVWDTVQRQIRQSDTRPHAMRWVWVASAIALAWRALQLLVELPLPMLHPVVPLALAITVLWRIGADPLAIQTFAPELRKRGL